MLNISPAPVSSAGLTFGTITRVQSASGNTGNASAASFTITFGANLTVGNLVVVASNAGSSFQLHKIVDSAGNLVLMSAGPNTSTPQIGCLGFMVVQTAGTVLTVSQMGGGTANACGVAVEYSGAKFRLDTAEGNSGTSATSTTATLVTNGSNELIVASLSRRGTYASEQTAWLTSPTNSFSSVLQTSSFTNVSNADATVAFLERIVSSAGSYSAAGTQANVGWANCIGGFVSD